jgi:hypothetical protein
VRPPAVISLAELARVAGVTSHSAARLLAQRGVAIRGGGKRGAKRFVLLADLRRLDEDLFDSITLSRRNEEV